MAWLAVLNRLATGDRMGKWSTQADTSCILCRAPIETRNHIFFECSYSSAVWKGLSLKLMDIHYSNEWNKILRFKEQDCPFSHSLSFSDNYTLLVERTQWQATWRAECPFSSTSNGHIQANSESNILKPDKWKYEICKSYGRVVCHKINFNDFRSQRIVFLFLESKI